MDSKPLVLVDLDDTLMDSMRLKRVLFSFFEGVGHPKLSVKETYASVRTAGFTLDRYMSALGIEEQRLPQIREQFMTLVKENDGFLYPGAAEFLQDVSEFGHLWLATFGDVAWQKFKLEANGLAWWFEK